MTMTSDLPAAAGRVGWRSSEMPMDDPALVEALRAGDSQAPRLLIEQYQGVVFGLCYRMMNHRQDAEDVVQETFVRGAQGHYRLRCRAADSPLASGDRRQPLPDRAGPPGPAANPDARRAGRRIGRPASRTGRSR